MNASDSNASKPSRAELERMIGAVIVPSLRPPGGLALGSPARQPSAAYMQRFAPLGVIGFGRRLSDGATIEGLRDAIANLRATAARSFFVACDLERGAGYHVPGLTLLPPVRAIVEAQGPPKDGVLWTEEDACDLLVEAARRTGSEARTAGIELILAPVLDVNSNPRNPIIGARAMGLDADAVAHHARAFLRGLHAAGVGASLKHFPGHGDTSVDSHLALPRVERRVYKIYASDGSGARHDSRPEPKRYFDDSELQAQLADSEARIGLAELERIELLPYTEVLKSPEAAALGDALTVMVGHLDVPDLTRQPGVATSLAPKALQWLARAGFEGAVLTDGLEMLSVADEPRLGERALAAGCHGLLGPRDELAMAEELLDAVLTGRLPIATLREAARRMAALHAALGPPSIKRSSSNQSTLQAPQDSDWGLKVTQRALARQPHAAVTRARWNPGTLVEWLGAPALIDRMHAARPANAASPPDAGPPARVLLASPKHPAPQKIDALVLWFGPPETVPRAVREQVHLWAWAPDATVETALLWHLGLA